MRVFSNLHSSQRSSSLYKAEKKSYYKFFVFIMRKNEVILQLLFVHVMEVTSTLNVIDLSLNWCDLFM